MLDFADYAIPFAVGREVLLEPSVPILTARTTVDGFIEWILTISIGMFFETLRVVIFPFRNRVISSDRTSTLK
jgi:hypothetical protein